jgi:nucleotide-binding universal stress UspA family protein
MYQKILVALEGKNTDEAAIAYAQSLAMQDSAAMACLEVVGIASDDGGMRRLQMEPGARGWRRKNQAEARLAILQRRMRGSGVSVQTTVIVGDRSEADEVVDYAANGDFDLIVMAADGRPWWQRAIFGCIADGVHRKATIPTLFVSDGTRREKVASKQNAPALNPIFDSFATVDLC